MNEAVIRTYTAHEVSHMRNSLKMLLTPIGRAFYPEDLDRLIEDQLRTYIAAGVHPDELAGQAAQMMVQRQTLQVVVSGHVLARLTPIQPEREE